MPHRIDLEKLNTVVSQGGKLLVLFSTEWCGESRMTNLLIEELRENYSEIEFVEIDIDDNDLWENENLNLLSSPTVVGYNNRKVIFNVKGYQFKEDLIKLLDSI